MRFCVVMVENEIFGGFWLFPALKKGLRDPRFESDAEAAMFCNTIFGRWLEAKFAKNMKSKWAEWWETCIQDAIRYFEKDTNKSFIIFHNFLSCFSCPRIV